MDQTGDQPPGGDARVPPPLLVVRFTPSAGGPGTIDVLRLDERGQETLIQQLEAGQGAQEGTQEVAAILAGSAGAGATSVIVDMRHQAWINSTGLGTLINWFDIVRKSGGRLVLANLSPRIVHVFAATKLDKVIPIYPSLNEAAAALSAKP